ncbi:GFA family protein [Ruegeria meonggei]|uniref:Glutathione-dependent formaldehyde-activating enzyme n=1 Tax=Ruegeria meonggei TaxID=1446476 RepID=A0A1X6ZQR1_9RHOB|nr:GFA family protein [Ruegeria meonggei]SLN58736.1 Glutathione-dependent formaldehyde-activating enzyme [Ruegeria meonggei]
MHTGSCLCGAVAFTIDGTLSQPSACHCGQCRKQSGHVWASTSAHQDKLSFTASDTLTWFRASDIARRGFCNACGSFLFWQHNDEDTISISMGALREPTGLKLARHIFVADKGDYYDITDDLPQEAQ